MKKSHVGSKDLTVAPNWLAAASSNVQSWAMLKPWQQISSLKFIVYTVSFDKGKTVQVTATKKYQTILNKIWWASIVTIKNLWSKLYPVELPIDVTDANVDFDHDNDKADNINFMTLQTHLDFRQLTQ